MALDFKHDFTDAAINCNFCSAEKDTGYQIKSNEALNNVLGLARENTEEHKLVVMLLKKCDSCYFEEPRRSRCLEAYGIET